MTMNTKNGKFWVAGLLTAALLLGGSLVPAQVRADEPALHDQAALEQLVYGDLGALLYGPHVAEKTAKPVAVPQLAAARLKGKWGAVSTTGQTVIPFEFSGLTVCGDKGLAVVEQNKKSGLYNLNGVQILPPQYDSLTLIRPDRYRVEKDKKFGLADAAGRLILEPIYKDINWKVDTKDELQVQQENKKYSLCNLDGKKLVPGEYDTVDFFRSGRLRVSLADKYGFLDTKGAWVIPAQYDNALAFFEDATLVRKDKDLLAIDTSGKVLAKLEGKDILYPYFEGYAVVKTKDNNFAYVDKTGKVLTTVEAERVLPFVNGSALIERKIRTFNWATAVGFVAALTLGTPWIPVGDEYYSVIKDYKLGYLNQQGQEYIPTKNDFNGAFYKDRVMTCVKDKYGYLNRSGEPIVPVIYDDISSFGGSGDDIVMVKQNDRYSYYKLGQGQFKDSYAAVKPFSEGLAAVDIGEGKWGYVDETGATVIRPKFERAGAFSEGVASVRLNDKMAVIDKTGTYILAPTTAYEDLQDCKQGVIPFKKAGKWGLLDKTGKVVVDAVYSDLKF